MSEQQTPSQEGLPLVVILGSSGMLGSYVVREFSQNNIPVLVFNSDQMDIASLQDVELLDDLLKGSKKRMVVINCAAYTNVDGAEEDVEQAYYTNAVGCINLACVMRKIPNSFVLNISTDYVYNSAPLSEFTHPHIPCTVYGKSKLMGELALSAVPSMSLRVSWLYGATRQTFPQYVAENYGAPWLKIVEGNRSRPTYCGTLATNIRRLCQNTKWFTDPPKVPRVMNYSLSPDQTRKQFATKVMGMLGIEDPQFQIIPFKEYRAQRLAPVPEDSTLYSYHETFGMQEHSLWRDLHQYLTELWGADYVEVWKEKRAQTKKVV